MAKSKKKSSKKLTLTEIILALIIFILGLIFGDQVTGPTENTATTGGLVDGKPAMHFVDVGQGDCTLITYNGDAVLIDAGPVSAGDSAAEYVMSQVDAIDYFIITHPHEDHMGGAADILENIKVKNVIMPDHEVETKFYQNAMKQIADHKVNVIYSEAHAVYDTGNIKITIIDSVIPDEENLNNISIIARIDVGSTSIMTTGDAEVEEEMQVVENYTSILGSSLYDPAILDCDILQVGHHGSSTSSTSEFLDLVTPGVAVISCGVDNSYGHPHQETLDLFADYGFEVYRTDLSGTIVLSGEP
ncbi:MAG: MBL fold metallo-hydrolase [Clostridia bacterium]|nr:MBL fold metallo-hydrolase [Clostridia bacterium]